jgi:signal transduction histidine kinase
MHRRSGDWLRWMWQTRMLLVFVLALLVSFVAMVPQISLAANFGSGYYGDCAYQTDCGPSTVVTIPAASPAPSAGATSASPAPTSAPLEVNINLTNGQVLPLTGYTVMVTPLNGAGTSFQNVDFYINGSMVHSQTPDEQGSVSWVWSQNVAPGTDIKVVITGTDGQTVTREFNVVLGSKKQPTVVATAPSVAAAVIQQITSIPRQLARATQHYVHQLTPPVKYSLPYFLFLLLGTDIVVLYLRARSDFAKTQRIDNLFAREKQIGELKHTFSELVAHYLRTPITIIASSLDLVASTVVPKPPALASSKTAVDALRAMVERLVQQTVESTSSVRPGFDEPLAAQSVWRQIGFYLPVGLIGVLAFWFDYLAQHGSSFNLGQLNLIIQFVVFISVSALVYYAVRYWRWRQKELTAKEQVLEDEAAFNRSRDDIIEETSVKLTQLLRDLDTQLRQLGTLADKTPLRSGQRRLHEVLNKLATANLLKGAHSTLPYSVAHLRPIMDQILVGMKPAIDAKSLTISIQNDSAFQVQNGDLFIVVLQTILDNAVAYSAPRGTIEISCALEQSRFLVSVIDHGMGIPANKQYSLFQAFSKTEGAETFNHEGMGFSLYMDKLIMNYLVGDIRVESAPQKGTKVVLSLTQP